LLHRHIISHIDRLLHLGHNRHLHELLRHHIRVEPRIVRHRCGPWHHVHSPHHLVLHRHSLLLGSVVNIAHVHHHVTEHHHHWVLEHILHHLGSILVVFGFAVLFLLFLFLHLFFAFVEHYLGLVVVEKSADFLEVFLGLLPIQ